MLPDTIAGGLVMSVINQSVVFIVLGFLAIVIKLTALLFSRIESHHGEEIHPEMKATAAEVAAVSSDVDGAHDNVGESQSDCQVEAFPAGIDPLKRAAIIAAVSASMGEPAPTAKGVFVRNIRNSAWGRSSYR